mmetsp:Transcript_10351/g.18439  ORF Transcript_10351/g.18439 Transcript_10351/m.18439 type:complete len:444 (-) Transcript_10351:81-1412(-)
MRGWHARSTIMKTQARLLLFLSLLACASTSKLRQDAKSSASLIVDSHSHLAVPADSFEETYLLLESAAVLSVQEMEARLLAAMKQASQDAELSKTGTVEMDLLGVSAAMMGLAGRGENVPESTRKKFVNSMQPLIDQLKDQIHDAHAPSQDRVDEAVEAFQKCSSCLQDSLSSSNLLDDQVSTARAHHRQCRLQQNEAYEALATCSKSVVHVAASESSAHLDECHAWPTLKATQPVAAGQHCLQIQAGEAYEAYLKRMQLYWTKQVEEFERMKALCAHSTTSTTTALSGCLGKKALWESKKRACYELQVDFEQSFCSQALKVKQAWDGYVHCYNLANVTYASQIADEHDQTQSRKAELRAAKRIDCLLKVFTGASNPRDAIEECRGKTHSTDSIGLRIHEVPEKKTAPALPDLPGSQEFDQAEYANFPQNAPVGHCVQCVLAR